LNLEQKALKVIRPRRESKTGWTSGSGSDEPELFDNWMSTARHWKFSGPAARAGRRHRGF